MKQRRQHCRDEGVTFVELLVTIGLIALVAGTILAAVTVIFRTEQPVNITIGESHDVQQAANYFHIDVESGPKRIANYAPVGSRGTGCSSAGDQNILRYDIDTEDADTTPDRRVAYLLTTTGSIARLDRYVCDLTVAPPAELSRVNIADRLDASGGPAVVATVQPMPAPDTNLVDRVDLQFAQTVTDKSFTATPRAETGLAIGPPGATCGGLDPLAPALGFGIFVQGANHFRRGPVTGSVATGGKVSWINTLNVATVEANNISGFNKVAVYANGGIDWTLVTPASPPARATTLPGGSNLNVVVEATTNYNVVPQSGGIIRVYPSGVTTGPFVETRGSLFQTSAYPINFNTQFDKLKACSDALAQMPSGADAQFIVPEDSSGGPYTGGPTLYLDLSGPRTQVLNLFESQLPTITTVNKASSGAPLGASKPLIVNVSEGTPSGTIDGNITWNFTAASWSNVGDAKFVLYNFPNTTGTLTVQQDVYGTIYAPYSDVITYGSVQGNVIAKSWQHLAPDSPAPGIVENDGSKRFSGNITWLP